VGNLDYHLKELKSAGAIRLIRSQKIRGATERTYSLLEPWKPLARDLADFDPQAENIGPERPVKQD
jgi:DNA-binding transcriptional ArsR family regulator